MSPDPHGHIQYGGRVDRYAGEVLCLLSQFTEEIQRKLKL